MVYSYIVSYFMALLHLRANSKTLRPSSEYEHHIWPQPQIQMCYCLFFCSSCRPFSVHIGTYISPVRGPSTSITTYFLPSTIHPNCPHRLQRLVKSVYFHQNHKLWWHFVCLRLLNPHCLPPCRIFASALLARTTTVSIGACIAHTHTRIHIHAHTCTYTD